MNAKQTKMSELLEAIVREAKTRSFEEFDRELKRQRQTLSDLKESVGMIQRQLRNAGLNLTPQPTIRTSPRDIRNFRKRLGVTQEVFAQMLHVNRMAVFRWENNYSVPHGKNKRMIKALKSKSKDQLNRLIQEANKALFEE